MEPALKNVFLKKKRVMEITNLLISFEYEVQSKIKVK